MYTKYEIKNGKVFAYDTLGHKKNMKLNSNIKEILICENDIEKMEELINSIDYKIIESKKIRKNKSLQYFPLASLWGTNAALQITLHNNWIAGGLLSINFFLNLGLGLSHVIPESKYVKINKAKMNLIKEYLRDQELILSKLKQQDDKSLNYIEQSGELSTSEKINELEDKLEVLQDYISDKRHYIKHYKKGTLKNMAKVLEYESEEQIQFLEELIKLDLNYNQHNNKNEKDKDIIYYKM